MQLISKLFTLIGLCFDVVGVILIAYDLFWGPGNKFQVEVLKTQLKNEWLLHKAILTDYKKLSQSIGENRAAPHINRENDRHSVSKKELEKSIEEITSDYPKRVYLWGFRGLAIVVIGFILQVVGTLLG